MIAANEIMLEEEFPARFLTWNDAAKFVTAFEADPDKANPYEHGAVDAAMSRYGGMPVGRNPSWVSAPFEVRCVQRVQKEHRWHGIDRLEIVTR
jgi:hypothetical protein